MALFEIRGRMTYEVHSEIEAENEAEAKKAWNEMEDVDFFGENLVDWEIRSVREIAND